MNSLLKYFAWDFDSRYKSLWLSPYLLLTWSYEDRIIDFNYQFYKEKWSEE